MTLLGRDVVVFISSSYSHRHRHRRCTILIFVVIGAASPLAHDFSAKPLPAIFEPQFKVHILLLFLSRLFPFFLSSLNHLDPTREAAFRNRFVSIATATERESTAASTIARVASASPRSATRYFNHANSHGAILPRSGNDPRSISSFHGKPLNIRPGPAFSSPSLLFSSISLSTLYSSSPPVPELLCSICIYHLSPS